METKIDESYMGRPICGFWRRCVAFVVDTIILGLLGVVLGSMLGQQFAMLGTLGSLVGFIIAICYLGIMNSHVGNGQSIGKKLLKICVVNKEGNLISIKRSCVRAAIVSVIVCNGLSLNSVPLLGHVIAGIVAVVFIGIIYFYLFNKKTRQGIHDIICGSYVYKVAAIGTPITATVSRVHYITYAVILIVITIASYTSLNENKDISFTLQELNKIDGAYAANVNYMTRKKVFDPKVGVVDGKASTKLTATIFVYKNSKTDDELKDEIARVVLNTYPAMQNVQILIVNIRRGYNIGIAQEYTDSWTSGSAQKWKEKLQLN